MNNNKSLAQPSGEAVAHEIDEAALEAAVEAGRAALAPTRGPAPGFAQMRAGIRAYMAAYTTPPAPSTAGLTEGRFVYEMLALAIEHGDKHGWPTARVTLTNLREGDTLRRLTAPLGGLTEGEDLLNAYDDAVSDLAGDYECGWNEGNCRPAMERRIRRIRNIILRRLTAPQGEFK